MQIPLVDLQAQFQSLKREIMAAVEGVFDTMQLFLGPQSQAFEHDFAQYCGCQLRDRPLIGDRCARPCVTSL